MTISDIGFTEAAVRWLTKLLRILLTEIFLQAAWKHYNSCTIYRWSADGEAREKNALGRCSMSKILKICKSVIQCAGH